MKYYTYHESISEDVLNLIEDIISSSAYPEKTRNAASTLLYRLFYDAKKKDSKKVFTMNDFKQLENKF